MEFLPALPHWPGGGAMYAAGFRWWPETGESSEMPVASGRIPMNPVPATTWE